MRFLFCGFRFCGFECYTYFYLEIGIRILFGENYIRGLYLRNLFDFGFQ